jgi:hypothetical protein
MSHTVSTSSRYRTTRHPCCTAASQWQAAHVSQVFQWWYCNSHLNSKKASPARGRYSTTTPAAGSLLAALPLFAGAAAAAAAAFLLAAAVAGFSSAGSRDVRPLRHGLQLALLPGSCGSSGAQGSLGRVTSADVAEGTGAGMACSADSFAPALVAGCARVKISISSNAVSRRSVSSLEREVQCRKH